ncbi:elongation factor P maturation arginine rhamnosyltransferase EarP [Uliginosibacterium gangwonense]|uniref:elongation factor P maturation arginine rhamnosyltransferase EarP n=1 Tax=Uliginosibacterium gangwonense TaxID=392736 RepID=UPI000372F60D|nr:elongation factor P maturation arginine rhamnosyltransferase EarP [Uliginosibacterium gangwonense]
MSVTRCDIFCKVIDNYGDIGVCWRLARQLAGEHGLAVRLWVDDLASFQRLAPAIDPQRGEQMLAGVSVCPWDVRTAVAQPAEIVIEAFACDPPDAYIAAMAALPRKPAWINLEYLSAEDWVEGCHAMPSPHPRLPLTRHFFFPGFTPRTGGLLREAALLPRLQAFRADAQAQAGFWRKLGVPSPATEALKVSLFAYENAAVGDLLTAWSQGDREIFCALPEGRILPQVRAWAQGLPSGAGGPVWHSGRLTVAVLPFMPQDDYDLLLAACDLNFVRGEDSFVRAQWAAHPFVWHIYQQEDAAHLPKLAAFLGHYTRRMDEASRQALDAFWQAWEGGQGAAQAWPDLLAALPDLQAAAEAWQKYLEENGDLAAKLLIFCEDLLE